jgi:hypothetical protein
VTSSNVYGTRLGEAKALLNEHKALLTKHKKLLSEFCERVKRDSSEITALRTRVAACMRVFEKYTVLLNAGHEQQMLSHGDSSKNLAEMVEFMLDAIDKTRQI